MNHWTEPKLLTCEFLLTLNFRYDDIFEESMARFYIAEMTQAIRALHCMGYVHR